MVGIIVEVLSLVVLPMVLNKTTENRFHGIKPHLREIWFGIGFVYAIYALQRPESEQYFMSLKKGFGALYPVQSYILAAFFGAILFTGYWSFLGRILPTNVSGSGIEQQAETKKPAVQQSSQGANSPNIVGNGNTVMIGDPKSAAKLAEIERLLKTQQGDRSTPEKLLAKYPLGYIIFEVDYKNIVFPYQSKKLLDEWEFDWSNVKLKQVNQNQVELMTPGIRNKNGKVIIENNTVPGKKQRGLFPNGAGLFTDGKIAMNAEILAIREQGIVFLIGFKPFTASQPYVIHLD